LTDKGAELGSRLLIRRHAVALDLPALFAFAAGRAPDRVTDAIAEAAARLFPAYAMTSRARIAEFVAQTAHETGGYRRFEEDLDYGAAGLARTWPGRFAEANGDPNAAARALAHRPEAIANSAYARPREGNVHPGDGWRYRGRGMLQLTFRANYRRAGRAIGIDLEAQPDLAADPATSVHIALDYWRRCAINACCDAGDFAGARGLTNCGTRTPPAPPIGLADVAARRERILAWMERAAA
jgi:putative chitinase